MDLSTEDPQQLEITALKSIYDENFLDCPPPKAWKGAARLPEFIIRVRHRDGEQANKIHFDLHVKFPKSYPTLASPIFNIQQPIVGLKPHQVSKLSSVIHAEAQKLRGQETVFQVVEAAQDWLEKNVVLPTEPIGSLAVEMNRRALEQEQARKMREEALAEQALEKEAQRAFELEQQIRADAQRQQVEREKLLTQARKRAVSDATEVPFINGTGTSAPNETFDEEIEFQGVAFNSVRLYHSQKECLGTVWQAEPICDETTVVPQLELLEVRFESRYYSTNHGRKKLKLLENEIQRLVSIRHANLLSVLAVKLITPHTADPSRLLILTERRPPITLEDVLDECDALKEEKATDYLSQMLSALNALHTGELHHRGLCLRWVGLVSGSRPSEGKCVKLFKVGYHVRLLDMHRSDPFSPTIKVEEPHLPEGWLPREAIESPLVYTKTRDIHAVGVILLQMLLGKDVMERFSDVQSALRNASVSSTLQQTALSMLLPGRKNVSCYSLLADLAGVALGVGMRSSPSIPINGHSGYNGPPKTPMWHAFNGSPDSDFFRMPAPKAHQTSRWKEDWEELELLGRGGFGSVVKARNRIDSRIYAVKKIRLRTTQSDHKIFREVNALSRLNHRFIVRYYTTWVETSDNAPTADSSVNGSSAGTSVPGTASDEDDASTAGDGDSDPFLIDMNELGSKSAESRHSFPSIHFTRSGSPESSESDPSDDIFFGDEDALYPDHLAPPKTPARRVVTPVPQISRTLYIQMEYVERQTLKERIAEGLSEEEAWRLFQQIVDALVHISSLGIIHRDIKLTNIFIDGKGDCKVGDFGLATSSLAAVDPSDVSSSVLPTDADMTLDVGTRLYIAPEVQSSQGGSRNHTKADMYSLGIVFFEMNHTFTTGSERVIVIEGLRKPGIYFPSSWEAQYRTRQKQIITWLLQHNPDDRPTALELSQSPLLPPRMEDEYFKNALRMMVKPDSPHLQAVLSTLFGQSVKPSRGFLYDSEDPSEHATLNGIVHDRLVQIFRLHGAVDMEPPLLLPVTSPEDDHSRALFLDRHGEVVALPNNALAPFARLAARGNIRRIKRYHIMDIYRPNIVAGHPKASKAAVFDIITPDIVTGQSAAVAESISIVHDCIDSFANLEGYEIHISHTKFFDVAMGRVAQELQAEVGKVLTQANSSQSQKRAILLRKGIPRNVVDELEILMEIDENVDTVIAKLEKISPQMVTSLTEAINEVKNTLQFCIATGVNRPVYFFPLFMLKNQNVYFKGICFEVVKRQKRADILAMGGRYDQIINRFSPTKLKSEGGCAVGVQISLEKITSALAAFQGASLKTMLKEKKSYGYWSPRRCDVYVVSHQEGHLSDRLEVTALLWKNDISADMMYEFGTISMENENVIEQCSREGILFIVYPRPRVSRRDMPAFKVKSLLRGTEYEVSRQELVPFLLQQIAEQKRIDVSVSGAPLVTEGPQASSTTEKAASSVDVQLVLPTDTKKQRKQTKQMFLDRAFEFGVSLKNTITQSGMPIVAVDVPPVAFDEMVKNTAWITDEDAWKRFVATFPTQQSTYASHVRDAVLKRKVEGAKFVILFAVREARPFLLTLS